MVRKLIKRNTKIKRKAKRKSILTARHIHQFPVSFDELIFINNEAGRLVIRRLI